MDQNNKRARIECFWRDYEISFKNLSERDILYTIAEANIYPRNSNPTKHHLHFPKPKHHRSPSFLDGLRAQIGKIRLPERQRRR